MEACSTSESAQSAPAPVANSHLSGKALAAFLPPAVISAALDMHAEGRSMPQVGSYGACVLFANISGFATVAEQLTTDGLEGAQKIGKHVRVFNGYRTEAPCRLSLFYS
jgi:hypothetical protein